MGVGVVLAWIPKPSLRGNYVSNCTPAISGVYFMRLPRRSAPRNDDF
ncbi:hypothetical protein RFEPED_1142 [Rickettsia felis str. Pedreira]|uniref:Uncharacterized protein n=1 Tax=Rickettsia felis str. Pedreira TaxID=1359196 RepID=A0A0F3MSN6_RICFI|nr:hypothetical protein [Rickettsia felis]KJV58750.1 hypothetical protein RFEPED_1142 [Rickettsia felis str. Pedreira]